MLTKLREYDFYRNIPKDLTEASTHGSILSVLAAFFMFVLFSAELWSFINVNTVTNVVIDPNMDTQLRINFNITMLDLPCEFAAIDIVDVLGTRNYNFTKNINTWSIDKSGDRRNYQGRNVEQKEVEHDTHHDLDALLQNGQHAVPMDEGSYDNWLANHPLTFVNFYAPWCIWCQRLEPTWEAFAEEVEKERIPVSVVKVDCVANQAVCMNNRIQAFPSLRLFKGKEALPPDYRGDRTVEAFMEYVKRQVSVEEQVRALPPKEQEDHRAAREATRDDHPGCLMSGYLLVNRVPGNFHIEARSKHHNLNPLMANLSHTVNHLSFGPLLSRTAQRKLDAIDDEYFSFKSTSPLDGKPYVNKELHQAYHHYMKV